MNWSRLSVYNLSSVLDNCGEQSDGSVIGELVFPRLQFLALTLTYILMNNDLRALCFYAQGLDLQRND